MAKSDSTISSDSPDDEAGFEQLSKDLRELPTFRTRDDFLLRVKNRIETPEPGMYRTPEPAIVSRWEWMRGRMTVLSSLAALGLIAVVSITLMRNPAIPEAVQEVPIPEAVLETDRGATAPSALPSPATPAHAAPVEGTHDARGSEGERARMTPTGETLLDQKQQSSTPVPAPAATNELPAAKRVKEPGSGVLEAAKSESRQSTTLPDAVKPSKRSNELRDAVRATGKGDAAGMKATSTYEQEYVPIQNKDLIRMRTGAAVKDSATVRDSVEIRPAQPR